MSLLVKAPGSGPLGAFYELSTNRPIIWRSRPKRIFADVTEEISKEVGSGTRGFEILPESA